MDRFGVPPLGGRQVAGTDRLDMPGEGLGVIRLGIEPVTAAMRLEFG